MNSRERVLKTLNHEEPDRVPLYEGSVESLDVTQEVGEKPSTYGLRSLMKFASKFPGWRRTYKWAMGRAFVIEAGVKRLFNTYKKLGLDLVVSPAAMLLTKCRFPTWNSYVDEFGRMSKIEIFNGVDQLVYVDGYFNPHGWWWAEKREKKFREKVLKDAGIGDSDEVEVSKALFDAWGEPEVDHRGREKNIEFGLKYGKDDIMAVPGLSGVMEVSWEAFGFEFFSKLLYKDRKFVQRIFDERGAFSLELAKKCMDMGAEVLWIFDDLAYKGRTFFSPRMMEQYIYPNYRNVIQEAHRRGVKVLLHSCGDITDVFGTLVNEIGFDGINPIEPTAGMDIVALKKEYGARTTFIGNISPQELATGTPEKVEQMTKELLREVAPGGGFILASGHSINPYVKKANYFRMLDVARKHGTYPIDISSTDG